MTVLPQPIPQLVLGQLPLGLAPADRFQGQLGNLPAVQLVLQEKGIPLVEITLSVPAEETAASICRNWREKNEEIYQMLVERLFS